MVFESESQLSVRCFKCGCFGHRGLQCENFLSERRSQNPNAGGMLDKCWICGCLGHIAVECKEKEVTCFSCGERGHKQEDCTSPMANCWNCGKRGHIKKGCPLKKNVGMCFYCHQVGHHSKDCDQKVCYICASKNHLWTRCPLKGLRGGFQPRSNGYFRRMRHFPRRHDHRKAFHPQQFSNPLMHNQYYQSFAHQQQTPTCIRPKSDLLPLSSTQERTLAVSQERTPVALRRNSDPVGYSGYLGPPQLDHPRMTHSLDDFELVANQSSLRSVSPQSGFGGQRSDFDGTGFDMGDIFSPSDESLLKVTESEKDSSPMMVPLLDGRRKSLIRNSSVWKEIAPESDPGVSSWGSSSDVWRSWDKGLRVELTNQEVPLASKLNGKPEETSEIVGVDFTSKEKDCVDTIINEGEEGEAKPVQDQPTVQPIQETQTKSSEVPETVAGGTMPGSSPDVMGQPSPTVTSISTKDSTSSHISISTTSSGTQDVVKAQTVEASLLEVTKLTSKIVESSKTESRLEIQRQENDVQEELERVREQLAKAKATLAEKEQQLDKTQKIVQRLKEVIILENVEEHSTKGVDVRNRCANCIQILKNLESCEECVM